MFSMILLEEFLYFLRFLHFLSKTCTVSVQVMCQNFHVWRIWLLGYFAFFFTFVFNVIKPSTFVVETWPYLLENIISFLIFTFSYSSCNEFASKNCSCYSCFQARRALRALRGLVRLKSLIQGQSVKRQATATLRAMQTLARVQSQIRARRIRMSEENEALQRQLQQKHDKELEKLRTSVSAIISFFTWLFWI